MSGLIILSIGLTILILNLVLCTLSYKRQVETLQQIMLQQQSLAKLDSAFKALSGRQDTMARRIDQLATDVLQREIYQNAGDRHQLAIESAKQGKGLFELMQLHGLSSDEAALISSLHSSPEPSDESAIRNANLIDPTLIDVV